MLIGPGMIGANNYTAFAAALNQFMSTVLTYVVKCPYNIVATTYAKQRLVSDFEGKITPRIRKLTDMACIIPCPSKNRRLFPLIDFCVSVVMSIQRMR